MFSKLTLIFRPLTIIEITMIVLIIMMIVKAIYLFIKWISNNVKVWKIAKKYDASYREVKESYLMLDKSLKATEMMVKVIMGVRSDD